MLMEWAKTKEGATEARNIGSSFRKNGRQKGMEGDAFISYRIEGRSYSGYFSPGEVSDLDKILDYYEGRIKAMAA